MTKRIFGVVATSRAFDPSVFDATVSIEFDTQGAFNVGSRAKEIICNALGAEEDSFLVDVTHVLIADDGRRTYVQEIF